MLKMKDWKMHLMVLEWFQKGLSIRIQLMISHQEVFYTYTLLCDVGVVLLHWCDRGVGVYKISRERIFNCWTIKLCMHSEYVSKNANFLFGKLTTFPYVSLIIKFFLSSILSSHTFLIHQIEFMCCYNCYILT